MSIPVVTAIVVNWRLKDATLECLHSLSQLDPPCRTIVVDNGSGDGSAEALVRYAPHAELLALPSNLGFGAACNRAVAHALRDPNCRFVLLLNNDAIIHHRALHELLRVAEAHPEAGLFGPKVYQRDQPDVIWFAGARRRWGVLAAADSGRGQLDAGQFNQLRPVDYLFGAALLIRRELIEQIGLFDERFFLYMEDLDLCLRAEAAGFKMLFVPQAHVWHSGSLSTARNSDLRTYHHVKSTMHFLRKHTSPALILPVLVFWLLVAIRAFLLQIVRGRVSVIQSYWLGFVDGLMRARSV